LIVRFVVQYPIQSDVDGGAWLDPQNIIQFTRTIEAAGLDAVSLTDHPAPSKTWLQDGGHETLDPFVGLGFCAAVTTRIRLMTNLVVLPYRNPLLQAKSMTALDVLSGGRAIFVLGTGYLSSEFAALGVDIGERNALFDEAIEVIKGIWSTDSFSYEGRHFKSVDQIIKPGPIQRPHPPLWLGGNSNVVRDRVARWGQGWAPVLATPTQARVLRTVAIASEEELTTAIRDLGERLEANGRTLADIEILASNEATNLSTRASDDERVNGVARLSEHGVTWTDVRLPHHRFGDALETLKRFGEEVAVKLR
jgi:probable F420-dependent oxidoreductase